MSVVARDVTEPLGPFVDINRFELVFFVVVYDKAESRHHGLAKLWRCGVKVWRGGGVEL